MLEEYQTESFYLTTGLSSNPEVTNDLYQVRNKSTDIIEYEDFILARSIEMLLQLEGKLMEVKASFLNISLEKGGLSSEPNSLH